MGDSHLFQGSWSTAFPPFCYKMKKLKTTDTITTLRHKQEEKRWTKTTRREFIFKIIINCTSRYLLEQEGWTFLRQGRKVFLGWFEFQINWLLINVFFKRISMMKYWFLIITLLLQSQMAMVKCIRKVLWFWHGLAALLLYNPKSFAVFVGWRFILHLFLSSPPGAA